MTDLVITDEKIKEALVNNLEKILEDAFTSYDSPVKRLFDQEEFKKELQDVAKSVFSNIITSEEFKKKLQDKLLEKAVVNMMRS